MIARLTGLTFAVVTVGLVFPYGFPVVAPLAAGCLALTLGHALVTDRRIQLHPELVIIFAGLFAFLLLGMGRSTAVYAHMRGDFIVAVTGAMFIPVLCHIRAHGDFAVFRDTFATLVFTLGVVVAIAGLYKFSLQIRGAPLPWFVLPMENGRFPVGTALQADYNMAALGFAVCAIAGCHLFVRQRAWAMRWTIAGAVLLIVVAALLTGSRRFYVVFGALLVAAAAMLVYIALRAFVRVALRNPIRSGTALQVVVLSLMVVIIVRYAVTNIPGLLVADLGGQFDRLMLRLTSLVGFLDTLEGSRGALLARSVELIDAFGPKEYLLGDGFGYLQALSSDAREEYPHNPWVSALLYGGVLNVVLLTYVLLRSAWIYAFTWRTEPFLVASFFVTFAFLSVSGNTVFSSRLFLLLILLAYLLPSAPGRSAEPVQRTQRSILPEVSARYR